MPAAHTGLVLPSPIPRPLVRRTQNGPSTIRHTLSNTWTTLDNLGPGKLRRTKLLRRGGNRIARQGLELLYGGKQKFEVYTKTVKLKNKDDRRNTRRKRYITQQATQLLTRPDPMVRLVNRKAANKDRTNTDEVATKLEPAQKVGLSMRLKLLEQVTTPLPTAQHRQTLIEGRQHKPPPRLQ